MKKADRTKYKASSSARAAQLLSESVTSRPAGTAFGFGGYSGTQQLQAASPGPSTSDTLSTGGELEGSIGQHLRRLAKRDPTTRLKALQALKPLLVDLPSAEIDPVLLAWTPNFQRLVMDNVRTVRMEACTIMGIVAPQAGRGLVRALKLLLGPWCLAKADPHSDTAKNARAAFGETFPGAKAREAVTLFRNQVMDFLEENVRAIPEALGDMHKETPEERAERHERVVASSLAAMRNLLDVLLPTQASGPRDDAGRELVARVKAVLVAPGMLKKLMSSKSPTSVRSACCSLIALLCKRAPDAFHGPEVAQLAPQILGFIDEKDAAVHPTMWDMMLSFGRAYPDAWSAVNARKAVLPRLMALLRNACYGSAEVSFPAVLPYIAQMPKDLLGPDPSVISQLLASIWHGWEVAGTQGTARAAAAESYVECLIWTFAKNSNFAGGDQIGYMDVVLDRAFDGQALRAALGQTRASTSAAETVLELTRAAGKNGLARWGVELIVAHIGRVLSDSLAAHSVPPHQYEKVLKLLQGLHGLSSVSARASGNSEKQPTVFEAAVHPVTDAMMANLGGQPMPGPAAKLLSQVMQWQEGWDTKAKASVERVLGAFLAGPAEGQDAEVLADLTLAALQQSDDPTQSWSTLISALLLPKPTEALLNGHGPWAESPVEQAGTDVGQGSKSEMQAVPHSLAGQEADIITESAVVQRSTVCLPEAEEPSDLPESTTRGASPPSGGGGRSRWPSVLHMGPAFSAEAAGSASPSPPHSMNPNIAHSPAVGRLAYLCTLLSRMSAQAEQLRDNRELFPAEPLAALSKHLVNPDVLLSDPHAPKALALLLRGTGTHSFLSPKAVSGACEDLLPMLEHGATARTIPHIPCSPMCQSAQRRRRAQLLAQVVLHVLDLCLFSSAVMLVPEGLRHAALWLLCTVYRLACLSGSRARHGMNSPPELAFTVPPDEEEEEAVDLEAAARDVWEGGHRLADLSSQHPQAFRCQVQESLLHVLQRHIASLTPDQVQDAEEVEKCVAAARSIVNAACQEEADRDDLVEGLLAPRKGWPRYMMPSTAAKGKETSGGEPEKAAAAGKPQKGDPDAQAHFVPAFALALGAELGFAPVLRPSQGLPRSWLAMELLCFCEETGLQQQAVALCTYLAGREQPGPSSAGSSDPLVEATLTRLWDHITVPYLHKSKQHIPYQALYKLLPDLINGSDVAAATAASLLRARLSQLEGTDAVLGLLQSTAPALRCRRGGAGAPLSVFAVAQLKMALRQAPLMSALSDAQDRVVSTLTSLRTVTACFPLAGAAGKEPAASDEEADLLRQLAIKQLKAERSARIAMAASRRSAPESSEEERSSDRQAEADGVIAELQLSTVLYCWRQLSQDEWAMIMHRAHESIAALAVLLEDQAEAVIAAAQQAATVLAQQEVTVKPDVAVAILQRLGRLRTPEASAKLEPAAGEMRRLLDDPARRVKLQMHLPWLEILALVLQNQSRGESFAGFPLLGKSAKLEETISEALRVVWAGGVAAAVALSCSSVGAALAEQLVDGSAALWEAASVVLEAALSNQAYLTESIQALDAWSSDTGVKAVSAAVALLEASVSHDSMHSTALRLVLSPSILPQVAQPPLDEEADEEAAAGPVEEDSYEILVSGGVHPLLAARAADTAFPEAFVLAWSLLLACMMDLSHDGRRRLGLTCGHVDSLTAELLSMLVAVLPLEEAQKASKAKHSAKHGSAPSPAQAAAVAAAARAAGTQSSLSKEMLRLGVPENDDDWEGLAAAVYRAVLQMLPASAMSWFSSLRDRSLALATEAYTALRESPGIIAAELAGVSGAGFQGSENSSNAEFRVRASVAAREATAMLCIEDNATLEMTIRLPASWPLRPAGVECKRKVGVTEGRLRKWLLSIAAFLRSQNGSLADAMRLWRDNCVREFAGVEECLICYSVVAAQDGQLPRMVCATCSKGFHRACLYKWFRSSHKSVCPHCQSPW